jgi:hypothetical protein
VALDLTGITNQQALDADHCHHALVHVDDVRCWRGI